MATKSLRNVLSELATKTTRKGRARLTQARADKARREFNVWAWETNRQGRQARLGQG